MKVAYIGNFRPPHSTENHVATALRSTPGVQVDYLQENEPPVWQRLAAGDFGGADMILWTRTGWDWPAVGWTHDEARDAMRAMLLNAAEEGIVTVGFHLDRWWGLNREGQVLDEPFFQCDYVFTADGGHDAEWAAVGVNHCWLPPAVSRPECYPGRARREFSLPVTFVGSWQGGYHAEWTHRPALISWLQQTYGSGLALWPRPGRPALRGQALRDLYASTQVVVGDSCLVGAPARYWSDRIPETTGRGGFLIHPWVEGLDEQHPHLVTWPIGDWDRLAGLIDHYLSHPAERRDLAAMNQAHTLDWHTYERRMIQVLDHLRAEGALK